MRHPQREQFVGVGYKVMDDTSVYTSREERHIYMVCCSLRENNPSTPASIEEFRAGIGGRILDCLPVTQSETGTES